MFWNRLLAFLFEMAVAGFFLWCWREAGRTKIPRIGIYSVDLTNYPRLLIGFRWFILAVAATVAAFGIFILFVQP